MQDAEKVRELERAIERIGKQDAVRKRRNLGNKRLWDLNEIELGSKKNKEKVFSSRVHTVEFYVAQLKNIGIENVMLMRWGKSEIEPVFLSKNEIQTIDKVSKKLNANRTKP